MKERGFTLLELIIVIIIIGILATLAFTQYARLVEKGRTAEAKSILGQIRTAEEAYKLENGTYTATMGLLAIDAPDDCAQSTHYFSYSVTAATSTAFTAQATRCTGTGGKNPGVPSASVYNITITQNGVWSGTAGYY